MKKIAHILEGKEKMITPTEKILQPLPHSKFRFANPFIVLHHGGPETVQSNTEDRIMPHPHRGFAPVTFVLQGNSHHKDNAGNDQILKAGDAQWMFAGKGILHSEGPSQILQNKGDLNEFLQLWVNVPAANKWDEPQYQHTTKEQMPLVFEQEGVNLRLVSGTLDGKTGPINISYTPVITAVGEIKNGKEFDIKVPEGYWTLLYVAHGRVTIEDINSVEEHNLIVFEKEGDEFTIATNEDSQILLLSALPIDEPVTAKGNFVMNTNEEIDQAFKDYEEGKFGTLEF